MYDDHKTAKQHFLLLCLQIPFSANRDTFILLNKSVIMYFRLTMKSLANSVDSVSKKFPAYFENEGICTFVVYHFSF